MSDPLRTDGSRAPDARSDADRDAKIEQLLLVGLDHYFAGQHEQAAGHGAEGRKRRRRGGRHHSRGSV